MTPRIVLFSVAVLLISFLLFAGGYETARLNAHYEKHEALAYDMGYDSGVYDVATSAEMADLRVAVCEHVDVYRKLQKKVSDFDTPGRLKTLNQEMEGFCDTPLSKEDNPPVSEN